MAEPASTSPGVGNRYFTEVNPSLPNNSHALQLRLVGRDRDVLELGCAAGHMTRALKEEGCRVVAVDVEADAVRFAKRFAERAIVEDISKPEPLAALGPREFDVVLAGDVLEHLPHPAVLLERCRSLLRPGGSLVVSVPNVAHVDLKLSLLDGRWEYRDWGLLDRTHLRFFTRRSLDELLRESGYVPVEIYRVVRPVATTELDVDMSRISPDVVKAALADREAETYQFVVRAVVDSDRSASGDESELQLVELLDHEQVRRRRLESQLADAVAEIRDLQTALQSSRQTHETLLATRTFRYTTLPRRIYSRLKRRLGTT